MKEEKKPYYHRKKKKQKKATGRSILSNLILLVAIGVFCFSGFQLFKIWKGYNTGKKEYAKVRELAVETKKDEKGEETFSVNFEELKKINPDTVAWIRFDPEPSVINYPVVQGSDNEKYLSKTFSENENTVGAIFLDANASADFSDRHTLIYGHWMRDGSMFRHLEDYREQSFWEANPYFYLYTPDGKKLTYQIYSVGEVKDTSDSYLTQFATDEAFQKFLTMTKDVAQYDTGIAVDTSSRIVTLSTCTSAGDENRFVVRGVRVKEE